MKSNTKLTDVEIRWIKNTYRKGKQGFGCRILAKKINEGREKAGMKLISKDIVYYAIKRLTQSVELIPTNSTVKIQSTCPNCGYKWNTKERKK